MAQLPPGFPAPEPGDSESIALALETARALWTKNDGAEAVRWIRRAAEAAEAVGDDLRAVALARRAAELVSELPSPPPSFRPSPPPAPAALHAYEDFSDQTIVDEPTESMRRPSLQSSIQISELPVAPPPASVVIQAAEPPRNERRGEMDALRVVVVGSSEDGQFLTVRVLAPGEVAAPGATTAILVATEPGADLRRP